MYNKGRDGFSVFFLLIPANRLRGYDAKGITMPNLRFSLPGDFYMGHDIVSRIGSIASEWGERALILIESDLTDAGITERIKDNLRSRQVSSIVFDEGVSGDAIGSKRAAVDFARYSHPDVIIGVGGVCALSFARFVAAVCGSELSLDEYINGQVPFEDAVPYIELASAYRNPFMFRPECLVTDENTGEAVFCRIHDDMCKAALIDTSLTQSISNKYTATIVLEMLLFAVEGLMSVRATFFSDLLFSRAVDILVSGFDALSANESDKTTRSRLCEAGFLVALGMNGTGSGAASGLVYAINGRFEVPRSAVASVLLSHVLSMRTYLGNEKKEKIDKILVECAGVLSSENSLSNGQEVIRYLINKSGLPSRLNSFNLELDKIKSVVDTALDYKIHNHMPEATGPEDLTGLLETAY